jgi:hypothetical protein
LSNTGSEQFRGCCFLTNPFFCLLVGGHSGLCRPQRTHLDHAATGTNNGVCTPASYSAGKKVAPPQRRILGGTNAQLGNAGKLDATNRP